MTRQLETVTITAPTTDNPCNYPNGNGEDHQWETPKIYDQPTEVLRSGETARVHITWHCKVCDNHTFTWA